MLILLLEKPDKNSICIVEIILDNLDKKIYLDNTEAFNMIY